MMMVRCILVDCALRSLVFGRWLFSLHCQTYDDPARQDTATDGDETGEWALLVDVAALNGCLWRAEAKTDILLLISLMSS